MRGFLWEHTGSNRGPSACKADALNQLSYAPNFKNYLYSPFVLKDCKDKRHFHSTNISYKYFSPPSILPALRTPRILSRSL
jgi:hypothetical protein